MTQCSLYGKAHAGSKGDKTALVKALQICTDEVQIADMRVGEHVECEWPVLLSCNVAGFLEMRSEGDAEESSSMQEPFALVTLPNIAVSFLRPTSCAGRIYASSSMLHVTDL